MLLLGVLGSIVLVEKYIVALEERLRRSSYVYFRHP